MKLIEAENAYHAFDCIQEILLKRFRAHFHELGREEK